MSLINKMLKDLDKRSGDAQLSDAARASVKTVSLGKRKSGRPFLWIALLFLIGASAFAAWFYRDKLLKRTPALPNPVPLTASAPAVGLTKAPPAVTNTIVQPQGPLPEKSPTLDPAPRIATVITNGKSKQVQLPVSKPEALPAAKPPVVRREPQAPILAAAPKKPVATQPAPQAVSQTATNKPGFGVQNTKAGADKSLWGQSAQAPAVEGSRTKSAAKAVAAKPLPTKTLQAKAAPVASKKMQVEVTPQQEADNEYGKAVRLIEEGRKAEAMATLEAVLMKQYKHVAARQMLASMLIAEKRPYEAMNVLKAGLRLDSSQTDMAMLLARLQIEKGDSRAALATLQQSLTYARAKPDYQAFLAAVYQRENRHKEAVEHYRAALGEMPGNGVWWMGYGISLQAVGREADARTAFMQARDSGNLSPQIKGFVEQRLMQLSQ